jgi:hypothetical protein
MGAGKFNIVFLGCLTLSCSCSNDSPIPYTPQQATAADGGVEDTSSVPDQADDLLGWASWIDSSGWASWIDSGGATADGPTLPDAKLPDATQADATQADATQADATQADAAQPDAKQPSTSKPKVPTAPFSFDFEKGTGILKGNKDWQWGKLAFSAGPGCWLGIAYPPKQAHSGSHVWGTVLNDCYTAQGNGTYMCNNATAADDSILELTFQIPASFKSAWLVFWEWRDAFSNYDWTETYVGKTRVQRRCLAPLIPTKWVRREVDLGQHVGKTVTVGLHFIASKLGNRAGWYIDDLSVTEKLPPL